MHGIRFVLAIHNHQPVGNFDHVIEEAYQRSYDPFLAVMERHPDVPWCLHQPGFLWEWIDAHHPDYLERVATMVRRGQLELISGGFYEPILPVIPERDRLGQIDKLNAYLLSKFDCRPEGAWLAERVWEPHLASTLEKAGLDYSIVDDTHFQAAGLSAEDLDGYFTTEDEGRLVYMFPIQQRLRYLLPFAPASDTVDYLEGFRQGVQEPLLVHADDGEKFGIWPGTYELCYEQGWLDEFLNTLKELNWLQFVTFSQARRQLPPRGTTYLPTASYAEMSEWTLPVRGQRLLRQSWQQIVESPDQEQLKPFVRGGFWRNFMSRYPESNWMNKRSLYVSRMASPWTRSFESARSVPKADGIDVRKAIDHIWASQCNCAYWHGLFGGLYLPHLRSAVYRNLIAAECLLEERFPREAIERLDLDADGHEEVILRNRQTLAIVKPSEGGAVFELDDRPTRFNTLDLMTRREEAYHAELRQLKSDSGHPADAPAVSIHDRVSAKEPDLDEYLQYDAYRKGSWIDHVVAAGTDLESFAAGEVRDLVELAGQPYECELLNDAVHLQRQVQVPGTSQRLRIQKVFRLGSRGLDVDYEISLQQGSSFDGIFAVEVAANLLAGDAPDRYYVVEGRELEDARLSSRGWLDAVRQVELVDEWLKLRIAFESDSPFQLHRQPIHTISMSEAGFEKVYQGSTLLLCQSLRLQPGSAWRRSFSQKIRDGVPAPEKAP